MLKHLIVISFLLFSSCSPRDIPKDSLFVLLDSRPQTLDSRRATDANGMRIVSLIFKGLIQVDVHGELAPSLALHWDFKGLTWTFYLRPGLKFSNGRAVNKEDILFSFKEFQKKSSPFYSAFKNIESVKVSLESFKSDLYKKKHGDRESFFKKKGNSLKPKPYEYLKKISEKSNKDSYKRPISPKLHSEQKRFVVKISLKSFQAPFLHSDLPVIKILPKKEILESPKEFWKKPFGTGNFTVEKNDFREILLKRKEQSSLSLPKYISFQIIRDSLTRTQKMLAGESDIAPSVLPLRQIARFQRQKEFFQVLSRPGLSTTYLLINLKNPSLKNRELREAISLSIHREEIIKYKLRNFAVPAKSFIPPESYFFNKNLKAPYFNLQKAKEIIQRRNWKGLSLYLSSSNNQDTVNKARVLASQMNQAGLKVSLRSNEWGTFYKDVGQGAYEMALMKWVGVSDPDIYRVAFHSDNISPKGRNRSFYKNKTLDKLLDQGFRTRDRLERKLIYDQIQDLTAKDFIVIPLWHDMEVSVLKSNIKNYKMRFKGDFLSLPFVIKEESF